jgi:hypothetical protein
MAGGLAGFLGGPWGAAAGMGVSLLGGLLGNRKSATEKAIEESQMQQMKESGARSKNFWDLAGSSAGQAKSYWSPLLSGNRTAMTSSLSPEIQGISDRYRMAQQSMMSQSPRSGAAQTLVDPMQKATDVSNLMMSVRPKAADAMSQLAQMFGSWGQGQAGSATAAANNLGTLEEGQWKRSSGLGSGVFNIIKSLLPQLMAGLGKQKPSGGPPYSV